MSAKWRRIKRHPKWIDIFKAFNRTKNKNNQRISQIKNSKTKKQTRGYNTLEKHTERKWKKPETLIDIMEENDNIIIVAELAGFDSENLRIRAKNQRLTLSAETLDRRYYKSLNLPKRVIPETIRTTYKNGVLEIRLKKDREEKAIDKIVG